MVVPQYLNVLETPPASKGAPLAAPASGAPTNGGAAAQLEKGGGASAGVTLLGSGALEDAKAEAHPAEGGGSLVAQGGSGSGFGAGLARQLETWQLLSAHEAGQCQLWHDGGDGLRPVAIIGVKCAPARRVPSSSCHCCSTPVVLKCCCAFNTKPARERDATPRKAAGVCAHKHLVTVDCIISLHHRWCVMRWACVQPRIRAAPCGCL